MFPGHFIYVGDKTAEEFQTLLDPKLSIVLAKEVKLCVMKVQQPGVGKSPTSSLGAFLQGINAKSYFNQQVNNVLLDLFQESNYRVRLASVAADGVSVEEICIMSHLIAFLRGESIFVAVVDTNHNTKNGQYQTYVGYSSVVFMGFHMFDCGLIRIAGVAREFYRVKDWASDLFPLGLASADTGVNIARLAATEDIGTVAVMCVLLYFTHLKLFVVNANKCGWQERVVFFWCSMIWISSFASKSRLGKNQNSSRKNVCSTLTETIGMVLSMARNYIIAPRFLITKPNKHNIAGWRMSDREATVLEVNQMEHAVKNRTRAYF